MNHDPKDIAQLVLILAALGVIIFGLLAMRYS